MVRRRYPVPLNRKGGVGKLAPNNNGACHFCGKQHGSAPCHARTGAYYRCSQQGHQVRDCPRQSMGQQLPPPSLMGQNKGYTPPNAQQGEAVRPPARGRTYAITRGHAEDAPNVITSMVSLNDHPTYTLFDLGATHSFITDQFIKLIGLSPKLLESTVSISTPLKDSIMSTMGCTSCKLMIGEQEGRIDLIVLAMYDFDVIIGMDWLTKQRAKMECYRKTIQFNPLKSESFEFSGSRGGPPISLILSLEGC
ncbi:hypothetical protein ACJRO7_000490 [Eucalyptus globulus]|uniref:CCHC-type domain-containing protein n=1 Tax=Eucalyptus globulus TaxID=34317 RepID=A0ABD3LR35_EUCGL